MRSKKRLAARILKTSPQKVHFSPEALEDIGKAITRSDIRGLIAIGKISRSHPPEHSRARARKIAAQKRKGRRKGPGSRKGRQYATLTKKDRWMQRVRLQREFLQELRDKSLLSPPQYRLLYAKSKGGYFRNKRHIKLYMTEHRLLVSPAPKK